MLQLMMERLEAWQSEILHVIATSTHPSDDAIEEMCAQLGLPCERGPLDDVLGRYVQVLDRYDPEVALRLTGDNPVVDARAIAVGLEAFQARAEGADVVGVSNHLDDRTDPYGYSVEVVRPEALRRLHASGPSDDEREHVTLGLRRRPRWRYESYSILTGDQSNLRWAVDTTEDFQYVEHLFEQLGKDCTAEEAVQWSRENPHPRCAGQEAGGTDGS
jgi:spore coat polysaccharide biosynthesis protein SpsF (cytidylyltransferase family)